MPSTACIYPKYERETESRKRKLSFCLSSSVPVINLEQKFQLQFEDEGRQLQQSEANSDILYDDKFYEDIDLDAIEAQATLLLKHKSESLQEQKIIPQPQNPGLISSPSFDLGI